MRKFSKFLFEVKRDKEVICGESVERIFRKCG